MYNKYFTMKKSELKESIKAEIKSILSEAMSDEEREDKLQQAKRGGGKEKPLRKLAAIGKKEDSLKEESRFPTQADIDDIENSGNIDIAYDKAMKLLKSLMNKSVSFADIREDEDEDDKAASKSAKKEKLGKQASKLSKEDEDRYERIKNGLEKLKKKGDEESIKKMKAILGKKDVEKLIKSKGRTKASFM